MSRPDSWIFEHVRSYVESQIEKLQAEMDRRFHMVQREMEGRDLRIDEGLGSLRREAEIVNTASELAIAKAERATEARLESVNEWRSQSLDRERSMTEERAKIAGTYLPREVYETWKDSVERRLNLETGEETGKSHERNRLRDRTSVTIAGIAAGAAAIIAVIALVTLIATHGVG